MQCSIANAINETFKKFLYHLLIALHFYQIIQLYVRSNRWVKQLQNLTKSLVQIPCTLHVIHIISTNFEEMSFGKTSTTIGFTKEKHPFNLLYLIWKLHNGYNKSNKESPLGMKAIHIQSLYQLLLEQHFQSTSNLYILDGFMN